MSLTVAAAVTFGKKDRQSKRANYGGKKLAGARAPSCGRTPFRDEGHPSGEAEIYMTIKAAQAHEREALATEIGVR
jgi:hypothetical protein